MKYIYTLGVFMKVLITVFSGFIGFHLSRYLLKKKFDVFGIDNVNDYYDQV